MKTYSLLIAALLFTSFIVAQTNEEAPETISRSNLVNLVATEQLPRVNNNLPNNSVLIQQVGQANTSYVNIASSSSMVTVSQNGNSNNVALALRGNNISESVYQLGNGNSVIDISSNNASGSGMQVIQKGNNLELERYGTSRTSGPLKVTQTGNGSGQAVIVRQFN